MRFAPIVSAWLHAIRRDQVLIPLLHVFAGNRVQVGKSGRKTVGAAIFRRSAQLPERVLQAAGKRQ